MADKMTYVKALEFAMSQLDSTVSKEVTDKLEALKAQLEKRAQYKSKSGKNYVCVTGNAFSSWRAIYDHASVYRSFTE